MRSIVATFLLLTSSFCGASDRSESEATIKKATDIIFPLVEFRDVTIPEALAFFERKSAELDPKHEGIKLVLTVGETAPEAESLQELRLTMSLSYIPMFEALKYVAALTDIKMRIHKDSVVFVPRSDTWTFHKMYDYADWQRKAVARYPDLGIAGSPLHTAFMRDYQQRKQSDPEFLKTPDWPMKLAAQVAYRLPNLRPPVTEVPDPLEYVPPPPKPGQQPVAPVAGATASQIAKRSSPSVVMLVMTDDKNKPISQGSGFMVAQNIVVTNLHVIEGAEGGVAKFVGSEKSYNVTRMIASDPDNDIALVEVSAPDVSPLVLAGDNPPEIGDEIYAIGSPKGFEATFSRGNISGLRSLDGHDRLQITAPISPGSSGGPVLNASGEVIGVAVATLRGGQNINFAVPAKYVRKLFK